MWNNCGPATLAMTLSYFGQEIHQREPASFLKPNPDDKNVSPEQLSRYFADQGLETIVRVDGTLPILQRLLSNRIPVIVEDWIEQDDNGGMGHYRLLTGYNQEDSYFVAQDSYYGPDERLYMQSFYHNWRIFNRKYIVVFRPEQRERVEAILGPYTDDAYMWEQALQTVQAEALSDPADAFSWFNLGTTYTHLGEMELAAAAFDEARHLGLPLRMFWYQFEIFDAYLAVARYEDVANLAYATAYSASGHEEAYYYAGLGYLGQEKNDVGISYLRKAIDYNPNYQPAAEALAQYTE
jgi:tetratricopeptide (TPR) repeat protein